MLDDYLTEVDLASKEDIKKVYGRTPGKKRSKFVKNIKTAHKKMRSAEKYQRKVQKSLNKSLKVKNPQARAKLLTRATKYHNRAQANIKSGEKLLKKTASVKKVQKVLNKPRPVYKAWGWVKPRHKIGAAVVGTAALAGAGYKMYQKIKQKRQEGLSLTIEELRYEIEHDLINEVVFSRLARTAGKTGGKFMRPLGMLFDVMFIFDIANSVYKRFLSKAAKACKGSPDRKMCIRRYTAKAKLAQINALKSKIGLCARDKDPNRCRQKVLTKIENLKADIKFLKEE